MQPPPAATPPPAASQQPAGVGAPADLVTRFLAKLIDWILLSIVFFVIIVPLIIGALFTGVATGSMFAFSGSGLVVGVVWAALYVAYFAIFEAQRGQTLGKMLLKIEVRGPDGQKPSMEAAFKRNAWMALTIIPVLGGLAQFAAAIAIAVTINSSATNQGWHDGFAGGTSVIKVG